jgi:xylan 1,4-beta-xylosidase
MPRFAEQCPWFAVVLLLAISAPLSHAQSKAPREIITVDGNAPAHPLPHFWETMFGSGRAILTLRESYRSDLREVKEITDFEYVRFHAILLDDVGVYSED